MDLFIQYAVAASIESLKDSDLKITPENADEIGVHIGSGIGGLPAIERQHDIIRDRGPSRVSPFFIPMSIGNLASGQASIYTGAKGPNLCTVTACASGAHSIGEAAYYIRRGQCKAMIAGGTEATVTALTTAGFASMKALSTRNDAPKEASRPFDKDRDGFILSEGCGILILEDYEHAKNRGTKIYGELTGYGVSGDANHITSPGPKGEGGARAMKMALKDARLRPDQINYINAHGTSTPTGDVLETEAIKTVFSDHAKKVWISSTKSMTGHLLGATGALESVFCCMALQNGMVPPTINLENPGEGCDLDYVPNTAREGKIEHVMNNSFGFGGTNATLIFSKI
jgi:3-oxoacyl-[acyl-carrier-protein] synthase II